MNLDFNRIFQVLVILILVYIVLILHNMHSGIPSIAQTTNPANIVPQTETATIPIRITNLEQLSSKFVSAFAVNKENQFVVVDNINRTITFYEIVWNGPNASIQVKANTNF